MDVRFVRYLKGVNPVRLPLKLSVHARSPWSSNDLWWSILALANTAATSWKFLPRKTTRYRRSKIKYADTTHERIQPGKDKHRVRFLIWIECIGDRRETSSIPGRWQCPGNGSSERITLIDVIPERESKTCPKNNPARRDRAGNNF